MISRLIESKNSVIQYSKNSVINFMYFDSKDKVVGICGAAWGDEGKGKFTDVFAAEADLIARAQGGCNAGHTVVVKNLKLKLHQIPSGIIYSDKINVIGNGVVLDPRVLVEQEIKQLQENNISIAGLRISGDAHIILPWHRVVDKAREWSLGKNKIGTTARGIGPAYSDKANRCGIRLNELFNREYLTARLTKLAKEKEKLIFGAFQLPKETFKEIMSAPDQNNGAWFSDDGFNVSAIVDSYSKWAEFLRPYVIDSRSLIHEAISSGKKVLLEGAQGLLLDIDHGTYPFVTSSNCAAAGFATGTGIPPQTVDRIYNVMSAYTTRVGAGPFPTELGTEEEISVETADKKMSFQDAAILAKTAKDDYTFGKVIRHIAGEFGTTTGRPRRTGWFDAVACKFVVKINGPDVILSKLDVLDVMPNLKICTAYVYEGPDFWFNGKTVSAGEIFKNFPADSQILKYCKPAEYKEFKGWNENTTKISSFENLPTLAKEYLSGIEEATGCKIRIVSIGPKRSQTFLR